MTTLPRLQKDYHWVIGLQECYPVSLSRQRKAHGVHHTSRHRGVELTPRAKYWRGRVVGADLCLFRGSTEPISCSILSEDNRPFSAEFPSVNGHCILLALLQLTWSIFLLIDSISSLVRASSWGDVLMVPRCVRPLLRKASRLHFPVLD